MAILCVRQRRWFRNSITDNEEQKSWIKVRESLHPFNYTALTVTFVTFFPYTQLLIALVLVCLSFFEMFVSDS